MNKNYWLILFFGLLLTLSVIAQTYEQLEQNSSDVLLLLSAQDSLAYVSIEKLGGFLNKNISPVSLDSSNSNQDENHVSLKDSFDEFYSLYKNISFDSALVLFNQWYLELNNSYYDFAVDKFFSSQKTKILLFSTSISCYCTLEMCKNQLIDIIKLVRSSNGEYDYLAIDAYEKGELPLKYETLFVPSVIVLDNSNSALHKIQYDEEMISRLSEYLKNISHN